MSKIFCSLSALAMVCVSSFVIKSCRVEQAKKQARIEYLNKNCKKFMEQHEVNYTKVWYNCSDKTVSNVEFR